MQENNLDVLLESAAEFGDFNFYRKIDKRKREDLERNGLQLKDLGLSRSWPRLHEISWDQAAVSLKEGQEIEDIDISSPELNQAQRLWVIATKAKKHYQ